MVMLIGTICSLGLVETTISRYQLIIRGCRVDMRLYTAYENGAYVAMDILRAFSFFLFMLDTVFFREPYQSSASWKSGCVWLILVILIPALLAGCNAMAGHYRDINFVKLCDNKNLKPLVTKFHTVSKALVLFAHLVSSFSAVAILHNARRKWKDGAKEIKAKEWNGDTNRLTETVSDTFMELYINCAELKRATESEYKALKQWFMIMYFMYIIFLLVQMVHVLVVLIPEKVNWFDFAHSMLNISIYIMSFFFPYYTACSLHVACQSYHRKMISAYLAIKLKEEVERSNQPKIIVTYLCEPNKYNANLKTLLLLYLLMMNVHP